MKKITITKEEYDALLAFRNSFMDIMELKKGSGKAYDDYILLKDMDSFYKKRYKETYKAMKTEYERHKKRIEGLEP